MIKRIIRYLTVPSPIPDAEFDIENLNVYAIERSSYNTSTISYCREGKISNYFLICSEEKHTELIKRIRAKLKLPQP